MYDRCPSLQALDWWGSIPHVSDSTVSCLICGGIWPDGCFGNLYAERCKQRSAVWVLETAAKVNPPQMRQSLIVESRTALAGVDPPASAGVGEDGAAKGRAPSDVGHSPTKKTASPPPARPGSSAGQSGTHQRGKQPRERQVPHSLNSFQAVIPRLLRSVPLLSAPHLEKTS